MSRNYKNKIVLLDAHALLHRAYHAIPNFSTRSGKPTGALYGFLNMILRINKQLNPDYIIACYDLPGGTFRHASYDGYKAGRAKTDDALIEQINESKDICEALNIPIYSYPGFEADDMLGTIVETLKNDKDTQVIIASGDMDTMQLIVDDRVVVFTLKKGITDTVLYDEEAIIKRYEFAPTQIPDYKGLAGDNSDNIRGVEGIGAKTATELVKLYGSIENIYEKLRKGDEELLKDKIKPRTIMLLRSGEDDAIFSKTLATIRRDAPIEFVIPQNRFLDGVDKIKFKALCEMWEFKSLKGYFDNEGAQAATEGEIENGTVAPAPLTLSDSEFHLLQIIVHLIDSEIITPSKDDILNWMDSVKATSVSEAIATGERIIHENNLDFVYEQIERPCLEIVSNMNSYGIKVNADILKEQSKELHLVLNKLEKEIHELAGEEFLISSPKQLAVILYDKLMLGNKIKKTSTGAKSTGIEQLEKMKDEHPIIELIIKWRETSKLLNTYIDAFPQYIKSDGRIYPTFQQVGAGTGRMSCTEPNLQSIPVRTPEGERIRKAFIADKNKKLLSLDYSQVDLRSAAIMSGDENLKQIFFDGIDVHTGVASRVFKVKLEDVTKDMRRKAKAINFGILYGMGVTALREAMEVDRAEAQQFYDDYKMTFHTLASYMESVKEFAAKHGYVVTLTGRRRQVPLLKSKLPFLKAQGERIAINAPMQGTSADIIKLGMIDVNNYINKNNLESRVNLCMQIHDELVYEIDKNLEQTHIDNIREILVKVLSVRNLSDLPLEVSCDSGNNLYEI